MKQIVHNLKVGVGISALLVSMLLSHGVTAQDYVTVSAHRYIKVIQPMELSGRDLEQYRIFSLADAVRYYSGVQFKDYGGLGGFKTINVRSLGSERVGVFYNGVEMSNAQNGQIDLTKFSLDNIGKLSLYSGQKGDIFQSATDFASAGSLYIDTQRPRFSPDSKSNFKAKLRYGSHLTVNPSLLYEHDLGNYLSTSVSMELMRSTGNYPFWNRRRNAQGELMYNNRHRRSNDDIHATRLETSLNGIFDGGLWSLYGYNYSSERGIPGAIVNETWYRGERLIERNSFLQGNVKIDVAEGYRTQVNFKLAHDFTHYINSDDRIRKIDDTYRFYEAFVSNSHRYAIMNSWDISGAYDLHWNFMQKRNEFTLRDDPEFVQPWRLRHLLSLATQGAYKGLQAQASVLGTYVQNFVRRGEKDYDNEKAITPTVLISYTPFRRIDFAIQAFVKQSYRVPNYNDRYISSIEGDKLLPENMWQYNLGLIYNRKSDGMVRAYGVTAEAYYNEVKNKIIAYPKGQLYRWSMVNLGKVRIIGGDASAHMTLRFMEEFDISGKVQYTYQQARDITNPYDTFYENQIPNIPWHSGSAILNLSWRGWSLNYSFLYVGKRYSRQENIPYYEMQPWYTHDLSIMKRFRVGNWNFRCMGEINNVLGDDFPIITNYPMPKQLYRLTVMAEI